MDRPEWWNWPLTLTIHIENRMEERDFSEVDLRAMRQYALDVRPAGQEGRWHVRARHGGREWTVVLEPHEEERVVIAVTAYPR